MRQIAVNAGQDGAQVIQTASSVASLLLTTDALVSDKPEKEKKERAGSGM